MRTGRAGLPERGRDRAIQPSNGAVAFLLTWMAAAFVSSLVVMVGGGTEDPLSIPLLAASLVVGWAVLLTGTWLTSRVLGSGDAVADFGLTARPFDLVGVPLGIAGQLLLVPAVYAPLRALWPDTFDEQALTETAEDLVERADGALLVLLAGLVVVGAPLVEEVVYRGLLQRPLLGQFSPWFVVPSVALVFALIHFRPVEYPGLFVAGLVFGICAWRTGRIGMAIAAHVGFNATGLALAL